MRRPASGADAPAAPPDLAEAQLTRHDGHPFARGEDEDACAFCGESAEHILHHPTRIRAACLLRGIDPAPLLERAQR
jgi:hypothetical protein